MPTVPRISGPSEQLNAAPNAYQSNSAATADAFGAGTGRLLSQAGQVVDVYGQQLQQARAEADQVRVDDALNRIKERQIDLTFNKDTGFINAKGLNAIERASGRPLADEFTEELQKTISDLTMGMGNDRQRQAFQMRANDILTGFRGQVMQHEGKELQNYTISVRESTIENRMREVGLFWNDPAKTDDALLSIKGAVADIGRITGKPAEWVEAQQRRHVSSMHVIALSAALEQNNPAFADAYFKKHANQMDAVDTLRVRGLLDKKIDANIAISVADDVMKSEQPRMAPTNLDRMLSITVQTESGGRRYGPDGKTLLTSPKGAKGEMQVMDATMRDPGLPGVKPIDPATATPEQRAQFGRDYFSALVTKYEGDPSKVWAAYNGGFGRVDREVKDAVKRGKPDAWLSNMLSETRNYVAKNVAALGDGGGAPVRPTLAELQDRARERIGSDNPERLKLASDEIAHRYELQTKAIKQRSDEAEANAQRWLLENNGRISAMPTSLWNALPPDKAVNLYTAAEKIRTGNDATNPAVYLWLSNDENLRKLSENELFTITSRELSQSDQKHFFNRKNQLLAGKEGDKPGDLPTEAIGRVLDGRLRELGVDPAGKNKDHAARVVAIKQFVDRSVLTEQEARGKRMTHAEVMQHIDGIFAKTETISEFFGNKTAPMLTMEKSDIPDAALSALQADFKAKGISKPTDAQLLGAYWLARTAVDKKKSLQR